MREPIGFFPRRWPTRDEFERFAEAIDAPLVANMTEFGKSPLLDARRAGRYGLCGGALSRHAAARGDEGGRGGLATLASDGTQAELLDLMQTRQELYDLIGYEDYEARDRGVLSERQPSRRAETMSEPIYSPGLGRGHRRRNGHQHDHRRPANTAAIRSTSWPGRRRSRKSPICCCYGELPKRRRTGGVSTIGCTRPANCPGRWSNCCARFRPACR